MPQCVVLFSKAVGKFKLMKIYLAGKVPKGDETGRVGDWRTQYVQSAPWINFLTPINQSLDYSDAESVFGHDCHLIKISDAVIVDASTKLGVGTSQEILVAKYFKKFVICVVPLGSHHRKLMMNNDGVTPIEDWIHPFIKCTADEIVSSIGECIDFFRKFSTPKALSARAKGIDIIDQAVNYHLSVDDEICGPGDKEAQSRIQFLTEARG